MQNSFCYYKFGRRSYGLGVIKENVNFKEWGQSKRQQFFQVGTVQFFFF